MKNKTLAHDSNIEPNDEADTLVRIKIYQSSELVDNNYDETLPRQVIVHDEKENNNDSSFSTRAFRGIIIQSVGRFYGYAAVALGLYFRLSIFSRSVYGDYGIVFAYLSFFSVFADAGIMFITVREASRFPEQIKRILSTTFTLKTFFALASYGSGGILLIFTPYSSTVKLAIVVAGLSMMLVSICGAFDVVFQSRLRFVYPTLADISLKNVVFIGTVILFVFARFSAQSEYEQILLFYLMIGINVLANMVMAAIYFYGGYKEVHLSLSFDWSYCKSLLTLSLPMGVIGILSQIHLKADAILLSILKDSSEFAVYNLAYRVIDIIFIFFGVFANIMFPVLARFSEQDKLKYQNTVNRILNSSITLCFPIAVGVSLMSHEIVTILGGSKYPQAALPLSILAFSMIPSFLNLIYSYIVIVQNRQNNLIWATVVIIVANISLNLYAIPRYSYIGSAVAEVTTETIGVLLVISIVNRYHYALPSTSTIVKTIIGCITMVIAVLLLKIWIPTYFISLNITLAAIIEASIYGITAFGLYAVVLYSLEGIDSAIIDRITRLISQKAPQ